MWIALVLIAAFIIWHFLPKRDQQRPSPKFRTVSGVVATDPSWVRKFEAHCESPAETAFLRAMIEAYHLSPAFGSLSGSGLQLDCQVEEGGFRVDFLANRWLVVEIDGAAFHSSREAVARDEKRDQHLESLGYSVLRIPAKVVFNTPAEAVSRVRLALQTGPQTFPVQTQKSGWQRLSDTMVSISEGLSEINASMDRTRAIDGALKEAKSAFEAEKSMIGVAISCARSDLKAADLLMSMDERRRASYEQAYSELSDALARDRSVREDQNPTRTEIKPFPAPPAAHERPDLNLAIQEAYRQLAQARADFLDEQHRRVMADPRLPPIVEKQLGELGCAEYWATLCDTDPRARLRD